MNALANAPSPVPAGQPAATVRVWDPVVRLFHWGVVTGCALNLFVLEPGHRAHRYVGYTIGILLIVRVVWGFIGTHYARFSEFFPTPARLFPFIGQLLKGRDQRMLGHNPLAAVMMLALMALLAVTVTAGYMMTTDAFWGIGWVRDLHELGANGILVLASLHALAAIAESRRLKENLIWSMVTGRKRPL